MFRHVLNCHMTTFRVVSNIGGLTQLCGPFTGSELKEGQWEEEKNRRSYDRMVID